MNEGRVIAGQYRLMQRLGAGSMGEVWRALDIHVEREVALKSLRPELSANATFVERFRSEAVMLAKLHHPNVASLYNLARESEALYMVMEFVPGPTLDKLLTQRGPLPWPQVQGLALMALAGLAHAHAGGIVHRDVKPANMLLTPTGDLKLTDFGIARMVNRSRMTRAGNWVGTMEYASPEQVRGEAVDGRSDLYALAIVLYELLTGELPFAADTDFELMKAQLEAPPPPAGARVPGLPHAFEQALLRAMAKSPSARFADAAAMARALEALGPPTGAAARVNFRLTNLRQGFLPQQLARVRAQVRSLGWMGSHPAQQVLPAVGSLASAGSITAGVNAAQGVQGLPGVPVERVSTLHPVRRWLASTSIVDSAWLAPTVAWLRGNPILGAAAGVGLAALALVVAAMRPLPGPAVVQGGDPAASASSLSSLALGAAVLPVVLPHVGSASAAAPRAAPDTRDPASAPGPKVKPVPAKPAPEPRSPVSSPGNPPADPPANPPAPGPTPPPTKPVVPPPQAPIKPSPRPPAPERPADNKPSDPGWYIRR
jgi:eukaryotic-like serine/threonine-protein kinase